MDKSFQDRSARVLIVDDDAAHRAAVSQAVKKMHRPEIQPYLAENLNHAIEILESTDIDICISDFQLWNGATALDLLQSAQHRGLQVPFVAVTGVFDEDPFAHELLVAGFDDVLHKNELKDANLYRLIRNCWLRNQRSRILEQNAFKDPLTSLHNRRSLEARLEAECHRVGRDISDLAIMFLDLDGFKQINDQWGHDAGDKALCAVAEVLQKSVRKTDVVARLGGDEFVLVLPNCSAEMLRRLSEKLKKNIEQTSIELDDQSVRLSASVGIVAYDKDAGLDSPATLLKASDSAMYVDKQERKARRD